MVKVANHLVIVVINLEAMTNVCGCKGTRHKPSITKHGFQSVSTSVDGWVAQVAAVFLKREVFATLNSD